MSEAALSAPTCDTCHERQIEGQELLKVNLVMDCPRNQPRGVSMEEEYSLEVCTGCHEKLLGWMFQPLPALGPCACCPVCTEGLCDGMLADGLCDENCVCSDRDEDLQDELDDAAFITGPSPAAGIEVRIRNRTNAAFVFQTGLSGIEQDYRERMPTLAEGELEDVIDPYRRRLLDEPLDEVIEKTRKHRRLYTLPLERSEGEDGTAAWTGVMDIEGDVLPRTIFTHEPARKATVEGVYFGDGENQLVEALPADVFGMGGFVGDFLHYVGRLSKGTTVKVTTRGDVEGVHMSFTEYFEPAVRDTLVDPRASEPPVPKSEVTS